MLTTFYGYLPGDKSYFNKIIKAQPSDAVEYVVLNPRVGYYNYHGIFELQNAESKADGQFIDANGKKVGENVLGTAAGLAEREQSGMQQWKDLASDLKKSKKKVLGYVYTGWFGKYDFTGREYLKTHIREYVEVEKNIDHWYTHFPDLDGIFFDEVSQACEVVGNADEWKIAKKNNTPELLPYRALYDYVKSKKKGATVVMNASGWHDTTESYKSEVDQTFKKCVGNEVYLQACDILGTYEASYDYYQYDPGDKANPNPGSPHNFNNVLWGDKYPNTRFLHIVLNVDTDSKVNTAIEKSQRRNAGYVYFCKTLYGFPPSFDQALKKVGESGSYLKFSRWGHRIPSLFLKSKSP